MKQWMVETKNLKKYYKLGTHTVKALDGVKFSGRRRGICFYYRKVRQRKEHASSYVGGLDIPTEGEVFVGGKNLAGISREKLAVFRRRNVGFIFQSYNLVPDLNVYENIILPAELDGAAVDEELVDELLDSLQLLDKKERCPIPFPEDSSREQRLPGHWR